MRLPLSLNRQFRLRDNPLFSQSRLGDSALSGRCQFRLRDNPLLSQSLLAESALSGRCRGSSFC
jgi:hypothetical protein